MKDKHSMNFQIPRIGIIGTKSIEKRTNGDIVETRTGSFTSKFVASFFLVVEDHLAKQVIDLIACDFECLPRKYIFSGVWGNQAACLFGFLMYAKQLENTNVPQFSILAIDDGDIDPKEKEKRVNKLLKGNYFGEELRVTKDNLSRLILSFKLEYLNCGVKKGLPEYNHKKWFEEIKEETIISVNRPSDLYEKRQVESLLELIDFSKSIILADYHDYYDELRKFRPKNTLDLFNMTEYFVLNSIKKYNRDKWHFYTKHIEEALISIGENNRNKFIEADIHFESHGA
jgi:hypothetical protein